MFLQTPSFNILREINTNNSFDEASFFVLFVRLNIVHYYLMGLLQADFVQCLKLYLTLKVHFLVHTDSPDTTYAVDWAIK